MNFTYKSHENKYFNDKAFSYKQIAIHIPNIVFINCSYYFNEIRDWTKLTSLTKIICCSNKLSVLPDFLTLINLENIDFSRNQLTVLPEWTTLINLRKVNFYENQLTVLPEWLTLTNLYDINCSNNKLVSLPKWSTLINLHIIWCPNNQIKYLNEWSTLLNLKIINLDNNHITSIPDQVSNNLDVFYYRNNRIATLPEWSEHTYLKTIDCSYNQLIRLPEWLTLINLESISCNNNIITDLPEWTTLTNLYYINCSNNRITRLPTAWTNLLLLRHIHYYDNPIEYIPPNLLRIINRQKTGQNIYNDNQSVHNHNIQQCLKDSINYLMSFKPSISYNEMFEQIKYKSLLHELLFEYSNDETWHSVLNVTFKEILLAVWNKIIEYEEDVQDEIIKILNIEMLDSECKCFTGRLTRLVNVLNGFDENIKIQISDNEQMSNISKSIYNQFPNELDYQRELRKAFVERGYSEDDLQKWINI